MSFQTLLSFIIIFGALVFFHELGHLVLAKRAGILCREFAIGFGPKVFSFTRNETAYTIRLLPIGGFVRMAGEDPEMIDLKPGQTVGLLFGANGKVTKMILNNKDQYHDVRVIEISKADLEHSLFISGFEHGEEDQAEMRFEVDERAVFVQDGQETQIAPHDRQFASKSLLQRTLTILAGPVMNFILAIVVFIAIALFQGIPVDTAMLGELTEDGAAKEAGLQKDDVITAIDGQGVNTWREVVEIIQSNPSTELTFEIERAGDQLEVAVTPKPIELEGETYGRIGAYAPMEKSVLGSLEYGVTQTYFWTKQIIFGFGQLITGQLSIDALSGPVGIYKSTEEVAKSGVFYLAQWGALLSINLAIFNLLPVPALDGGRLFFFLVEAIRGKPIDRHKEGMVHFIGFALLMLLMLVVTWNDIQRFFL
ncbi:RIP metalloprotease RseP [Bacillus sp. HMF5848]|nr:RIP metalloprotease RseP [Bacillus sp. HMF5848]RSK27064.1 RIP metalloprotease RseP [Bacillus sp. HMF5848]